MRHARFGAVCLAAAALTAAAVRPASAQSATGPATPAATQIEQVREELDGLKKQFDAIRQEYERRISTLEQRLGSLSGPRVIDAPVQDPAAPSPAPAPEPTPEPAPAPDQSVAASQPPAQGYAGSSKVFNPDISAIGNVLAVAGDNPRSTDKSMQLTEAEVAFQAVVDPYAKADFFLSAGPEGLEVEEGYITFTTLPAGMLLKAGKMRAQFGKVNTMHTHILPWADRPLVMQNLLGGEEGLSDSGLSVSRLIPNKLLFLEGTGEIFQGDSPVFQTDRRSRLVYLGRLRGYRDVTEATNLDLGVSFAHGPTDLGPDLDKRLIGVDATVRWRPLQRAIYHRFVGRTELVWSHQDTLFSPTREVDPTQKAFGFYASADYQFARRWYVGARLDRSGRAVNASLIDSGGSTYVTFWPSEFSQIRGQYRRTNYAEGITANELLFQFNFSIGAHGAHVF
jgi:hypothetical protein